MIRALRLLFLLALAIVLVTLALSNRDIVTLRLLPVEAETYLGLNWVMQVPLFLVIFAGMLLGLFIGFVWEWLREFRFRSTAKKATRQAATLQRELGRLKEKTHGPKDEVLALLDKPRG